MIDKELTYKEREREFNRFIVSEYLKYGSVDRVFSENHYDIPISYMGVHRLLDRWGIVKAAGPNSMFSEAVCFMVLLSDTKAPLEKIYKRLPSSFKSSMSTMHRVLGYMKEGLIRRVGTALVITSEDSKDKLLVGNDISTPRLKLGKPLGATSFPMGYSKPKESVKDSILRVLQQEVFTQEAIDKTMPMEIVPENPKPFMYLDIVDVRVAVYNLTLPHTLSNAKHFSSFKLKDFCYLDYKDIAGSENHKGKFRMGLKEIAFGYSDYLQKSAKGTYYGPVMLKSHVNLQLSEPAFDFTVDY